jgi:hypothetical protein
MCVTAHWIQGKKASGMVLSLSLWSELIGFHRVPGHHDGEHIGRAYIYVIDRVEMAKKVCYFFIISIFP